MGLPGWCVETPAKIATHASLKANLAEAHCRDRARNGENLLREKFRARRPVVNDRRRGLPGPYAEAAVIPAFLLLLLRPWSLLDRR
jgi:hypothetical protein